MKVTQKNIRAFHFLINSDEEFFSYFKKNSDILRGYFILLHGNITDKIEEYLAKENICYQNINECEEKIFNISKAEITSLLNDKSTSHTLDTNLEYTQKQGVKVYSRTIRSGEEIIANSDIIIKGRVNSGARVISDSNIIILGNVDGMVECSGNYLIIKNIGSGIVSFNSEQIEVIKSDKLKLVHLENSKVIVKELL